MIPFLKMQGLGNDFVVLDARKTALPVLDWRLLADRQFGVGCDQVIVLEPSTAADVRMRIFNADGSEVASCGNASRCVGWLVAQERKTSQVRIETKAGVIFAEVAGDQVTVDMGKPRLNWQEIPLSKDVDTLHLPLKLEMLADPVGVSMGNPHAVFFVPDANAVNLARLGPVLEHDALFPQRANIGVAQIIDRSTILLRVWERGAGLTLACGTGACAALVAAARRGLSERKATIELPGGSLAIHWNENDHVLMAGGVATSFEGTFDPTYYKV